MRTFAPIVDARTGDVLIPTCWVILAQAVTSDDCPAARELARQVLAAAEAAR